MFGLFGDSFNKSEITLRAGTYLKYVRDPYKVQLKNKPKYAIPLDILRGNGRIYRMTQRRLHWDMKGRHHLALEGNI